MRRFLAVIALFAGMSVCAQANAATSTWTLDPPSAPRVANGEFDGMSCLSARQCTAVGSYTDRSGMMRTLVETWNGAVWTIATPPPGSMAAPESSLSAVSCPTADFCAAVGSSLPAAGEQALVERWNGTAWSIDPVAAAGRLSSVSCTSADFCIAVGEDDQKDGLILGFNGTSWTRQSPAGPGTQLEVGFTSVSCVAIDACIAVGSAQASSVTYPHALAQRWDGVLWSDAGAVDGPNGSKLTGVSCVARKICFAVGISNVNSPRPLAELSTSSGWKLQTVPSRNEVQRLAAISCVSTTSCVAVGSSFDGASSAGLSELWDGTQWTARNTPFSGTGNLVAAVSCVSTKACFAAGHIAATPQQYTTTDVPHGTLVDRWNGAFWKAGTAVDPSGDASSDAYTVSCPTSSMCMLVGYYVSRSGAYTPVAEMRTGGPGSTWTALSVTDNQPELRFLGHVSCASATMCVAIGDLMGSYQPVAELWNGLTWSPTAALPITGGYLNAIDCPTESFCLAVGITQGGAVLGLVWNGSTWTQAPLVNQTPNPELYGVSCVSPSFCAVTGLLFPPEAPERPIAEVWDGSTWKITPASIRGAGAYFEGVSCVSAKHCVAVGSYDNRGHNLALAEIFNGVRWKTTDLPQGTAGQGGLTAVDCTSSTRCIAVGEESVSGQNRTYGSLIEQLDGTTWTATSGVGVSAPDEVSELQSVSCATTCELAGYVEHNRDRVGFADFVPHAITLSSG